MKRYLVVGFLTVVAVAAGAWWYVRDDYPFQLGNGDVVTLMYEYHDAAGLQIGFVEDAPAELPRWVSGWERDTSGEDVASPATVTLMLRDGRRLRLDAGGRSGTATWISADGRVGDSIAVHYNAAFEWYVRGLCAGHGGETPGPSSDPDDTISPSP